MKPFEIIDSCFCEICHIPQRKLSRKRLALVQVWHSFGVIQNAGMHGYLCEAGYDSALALSEHYRDIGVEEGAALLKQAAELWRRYWPSGPPGASVPDAFRQLFGRELDDIETRFYALEQNLITALLPIAEQNEN